MRAGKSHRQDAILNAVEIEEAISDLALQPFGAAEFPFAFLAAFGNKDTALKRLRAGHSNKSYVPGGVLQRNNIYIAVCESGNVGETLKALRASPATTKVKAKFILVTDGLALEAEELGGGKKPSPAPIPTSPARPRAQRRGAGAHLHRSPLQGRHRAAGKTV